MSTVTSAPVQGKQVPRPASRLLPATRGVLQRKPSQPLAGLATPAGAPRSVHDVLRSPGQPLDTATRAFMEPRFGHDFSQVRVHTDTPAVRSAQDVQAAAYTVGRHVVFGRDRFAPGQATGRQLLAHELAHVVQQAQATREAGALRVAPARDEHERAADRATDAVLRGQPPPPALASAAAVQRQPATPDPATPAQPVAPADPAKAPDPDPDYPQPQVSVQIPVSLGNFQIPLWGSHGGSTIFKTPSATNRPYDSIYQPNVAVVVNWSLHSKNPTGWELNFGLPQVGGAFGTGPSVGQLSTYFQPTWVFLTWGHHDRHQLSVSVQPTATLVPGGSAVSGTAVSLPVIGQYTYTIRETETSQWQFNTSVGAGGAHTDFSHPPPGTPDSQNSLFVGVTVGFSYNSVRKRYPKDAPADTPTPQPDPEPTKPEQKKTPSPDPTPPPEPTPAAPALPGAEEVFFLLDRPHPGQGSGDLSVLTPAGRAGLAAIAQTLKSNPAQKVQLIGATSVEGDHEYNYDLGKRRAEWLAGQLGIDASRLANPAINDLSGDCRTIRPGVVTCGATGADAKANPKDRRVLVRFVP